MPADQQICARLHKLAFYELFGITGNYVPLSEDDNQSFATAIYVRSFDKTFDMQSTIVSLLQVM